MTIRPVGADLFHADGQTDERTDGRKEGRTDGRTLKERQTDMTKFDVFSDRAS